MLFQLSASCRPSPKWQLEKGLSKALLSSPDCGHLLQREEGAMAACWVPVRHCCVFCPERERHLLFGFKRVTLINLPLAQTVLWFQSVNLAAHSTVCSATVIRNIWFCVFFVQYRKKQQYRNCTGLDSAVAPGATAPTFL